MGVFPAFFNCMDGTSGGVPAPPGELRRQESHGEREILLVAGGKAPFVLNGKVFDTAPGDAFLIDRNVPHQSGYRNMESDARHIWVHLHPRRFFALAYEIESGVRSRSRRSWEFPLPLLELINARWESLRQAPPEMRQELMRSIVRLIAEEITLQELRGAPRPSEEHDIVEWMKKHIAMNRGCHSSMAELEKLTGYTRAHLMRTFKNACGMTVGEYINSVRRAFVAETASSMSQKEIAAQLGFKSAAAFWLWKKRHGAKE